MPVDLNSTVNDKKSRRVAPMYDSRNMEDSREYNVKFARGGSMQTGSASQGATDDSVQPHRPFQLKSQMSRTHVLSASRGEH